MKVFVKEKLNHIPHLNDFLDERNLELEVGDQMECVAITSQQEFHVIRMRFPRFLGFVIVVLYYIWNEMCPKIKATRKLYLFLTGERHRTYSHVEILGRICRAGFKIRYEYISQNELHVIAEKISEPLERNESTVSPILRQKRVGLNGEMIDVYKFRTMHSYSQYLQSYIYELGNLDSSGKLSHDFRVNIWGRLFRPIWLDELPMLWNVFKGDMKWVGVRPLTRHFFSLYTPEMQHLRTKVRPGMLPPFYYEKKTPKGLDEIQASERRYIEAYLQHSFATDWRYFWGTIYNILLKFKRSK